MTQSSILSETTNGRPGRWLIFTAFAPVSEYLKPLMIRAMSNALYLCLTILTTLMKRLINAFIKLRESREEAYLWTYL